MSDILTPEERVEAKLLLQDERNARNPKIWSAACEALLAFTVNNLPRALATIDVLEDDNKRLEENNALKDKLIEGYQLAANPNCPHGRNLSKFCGDCDTAERDRLIELEHKVDVLEAERDAWKRYALALDAWQEHCVVCEHCHISAYQCEDGERLLRGEFDEARKAIEGL